MFASEVTKSAGDLEPETIQMIKLLGWITESHGHKRANGGYGWPTSLLLSSRRAMRVTHTVTTTVATRPRLKRRYSQAERPDDCPAAAVKPALPAAPR